MPAAAADSGDPVAAAGDSACSTPFVSAPSSPARDAMPGFPSGGFFSAPASPAHHGGGGGGGEEEYGGGEFDFDFDFDFSSRFPSPAHAAMSSADELFHNGQIRPMRLASLLLRPQPAAIPAAGESPREEVAGDERGGRLRSRSVHRRSRSHSPFRAWLSPPPPPPAPVEAAAPSASRSSSSSSTASYASSSSSRSSRKWRFLKDLLHRSSSDGGKNPSLPTPPPPATSKTRVSSPAAAAPARGRRRSVHERLYAARRAEVEEMRRRTFLPYQQGLLFGCLGLRSGAGAMRGLSAAVAGKSRS